MIIFADGDKLNMSLDNLLLVSWRDLVVMNKRGLITKDADVTKTGVTLASVYLKISERKKGK